MSPQKVVCFQDGYDDENISTSISEPIWWSLPPPMLVHYGQNPAVTVLLSRPEAVTAKESLPIESLPIEKPACKIKITDKGKALLLEMTKSLLAEKFPCKGGTEFKKFPEKIIDPRTAYHEKFGKAAWTKAVGLAGRHRTRAKNDYRLTEHFTAMEWLDLCARFSMKCPWCLEEGQLSPHHRKALHRGGANVIENIWPLCKECHIVVHEFGIGCEGFYSEGFPYLRCKSLSSDVGSEESDLVNPFRVYVLPKPERPENSITHALETSIYLLYPTCFVENSDHLEWWSGTVSHSDMLQTEVSPILCTSCEVSVLLV